MARRLSSLTFDLPLFEFPGVEYSELSLFLTDLHACNEKNRLDYYNYYKNSLRGRPYFILFICLSVRDNANNNVTGSNT